MANSLGEKYGSTWRRMVGIGGLGLLLCLGLLVGCASRSSDEALENAIKAKMFADPQLKGLNITVAAHNGTVTLSGEVPDEGARGEANQVAKAEPGVKQVTDQLTTSAPAAFSETPARSGAPRRKANPEEARRAAAAGYKIIPAGTEISVRTNETIDSKTAAADQTYSAIIASDVLDEAGDVAIPKGSEAQLIILRATSGRVTTQSELALDLDAVTVNGKRYVVTTGAVAQKGHQGLGKNKRTLEMTGGGAAVGALIGAIAGKGKGAAIGALAGAGAGAGAEVLTKGSTVRVPAESVLRFRLEKDLKLASS